MVDQNGEQQLRIPAGTTKDDLETLVTNLVETGAVSAEKVNSLLEEVRAKTGEKAKAASRVDLSAEQAELLGKIEVQYPKMKATLERNAISTKGIPNWEQVMKGLTPEVLDKASKLQEPTLLLVPPTTARQSKVPKFDRLSYNYRMGEIYEGKEENKWRVAIVEGVQTVEQDDKINDGEKSDYEMSKAWVKKYEDQGLDVMKEQAYLILVMKGLAEDRPIDPKTYTVLNGKNLTKDSWLTVGSRILIGEGPNSLVGYINPDYTEVLIRMRGLVWLDVPQT